MSKVGGLQLVKPKFDWGSHDKLTEIEQFKADCKILFDGPLCDLKDKQRAGLIVTGWVESLPKYLHQWNLMSILPMKYLRHLKRSLDLNGTNPWPDLNLET